MPEGSSSAAPVTRPGPIAPMTRRTRLDVRAIDRSSVASTSGLARGAQRENAPPLDADVGHSHDRVEGEKRQDGEIACRPSDSEALKGPEGAECRKHDPDDQLQGASRYAVDNGASRPSCGRCQDQRRSATHDGGAHLVGPEADRHDDEGDLKT